LEALEKQVGKEKLIVDISCRRREEGWVVAMNGWKTLTDMWVTRGMSHLPAVRREADEAESIKQIEHYCSELLIHAADVEGLCQGVDEELVQRLGAWVTLPCTYAGGARGT
jgi:phosphoribosylformimino-5-aminoimidazole carboxamide ribotide isomerase